MIKYILVVLLIFSSTLVTTAQTKAKQFSGSDCNGNAVDLFADLDSGIAVILHFYMPSCGSCPPPAKKIQAMAMNLLKTYPEKIKAYAFPFENTTNCAYSSSWTSSNGLDLYHPMDSGEDHVAHYGGFGMPTIVLLGGKDHQVLFSTMSFSTSDTLEMKNAIVTLLKTSNGLNNMLSNENDFSVFPNPSHESINIHFESKSYTNIILDIIDINGKVITNLYNQKFCGSFSQKFTTSSIPPGIYIVRKNQDGAITTKQLTIVR